MVGMIFIFISSSDPNLLGNKSVKQKIKNDGLSKLVGVFNARLETLKMGFHMMQ